MAGTSKTVAAVMVVALVLALTGATHAALIVGPPNTSDGRTYSLIDNVVGGNPPEYVEAVSGTNGFDTNGGGNHWGTTRRWSNGAGTNATWSFGGLLNGTYDVYASWRNNAQGNLGTIQYAISDGGPTLNINQIPGAGSYAGNVSLRDVAANKGWVNFAPLGQATISDGSLAITGTKSGGSFVFFDAMAITQIESAPVIPEPSTFLIWALGLLGLAWYRGRRSKGLVEIAAVPVRLGWTEEKRVAIQQMLENHLAK